MFQQLLQIGTDDVLSGWGELAKLLLVYVSIRFFIQPKPIPEHKKEKRYRSIWIYVEGIILALAAYLLLEELQVWRRFYWAPLIIGVHVFLEVFRLKAEKNFEEAEENFEAAVERDPEKKSADYKKKEKEFNTKHRIQITAFVGEILGHFVVLILPWLIFGQQNSGIIKRSFEFAQAPEFWLIVAAYLAVWYPAGFVMRLATVQWQKQLPKDNPGLLNAGKWIGVFERTLVLTFVLIGSMGNVGWLISAKSILRFGEIRDPNNRRGAEYILIGTLLSFTIAILIGLWVRSATFEWLKLVLHLKKA